MNFEETILSYEAKEFLLELNRYFSPKLNELLQARIVKQRRIANGETFDFLPETKEVRNSTWQVAPAPASLLDRRVEITGPAEPKMMINALNSGANVFMADLEDSLSPTWNNILEAQVALYQYSRGSLSYTNEVNKTYALNEKTATLIVRPRGLHLREAHFLIDNIAMPAALFDFGLHFWHNAKVLHATQRGPYFYLPKLESHLEARWWNSVFIFAQDFLQIPRGSVRATVLIETIPAAFEMEEILFELKEHASGLNAGRWDYIFSIIKKFNHDPRFVLPDRSTVTMATSFMNSYAKLLVQTCHRRGAHAIGGMSAFIPNRKAADVTELALKKVSDDKAREASLGFDGSWVAHPDLVVIARNQFDKILGAKPHQKELISNVEIHSQELLNLKFDTFEISEAGIRSNINVAILYIERWLAGVGAVSLHNLMEDAATAEISRSQLWQWLKHRVQLNDGREFTPELYQMLLADEVQKIGSELSYISDAIVLFNNLVNQSEFKEFLTSVSERKLNQIHFQKPIQWATNKGGSIMKTTIEKIEQEWMTGERWQGIKRTYGAAEVVKLRTSLPMHYSIAQYGSAKLWEMLNSSNYVNTFGAMTGAQAVQMVKAGLKSIYLSGWQVAADANLAGQTYPDQSLYPSNSVPQIVRRINNAFQRADQIERSSTSADVKGLDWYAPIVADAEAGFGGPLHAFELMKSMIEAGASGVHFEDQLAAEKKCGHLAGKVLVPTSTFIRTLQSARLAADVLNVPAVIIARTDAQSANLMTSDIDPADAEFLDGSRTPEGYYKIKGGNDYAIARSLAYAPWADVLWFETSTPNLAEAEAFAKAIHAKFPGKILAYNCSPSFNWKKYLSDAEIAQFQIQLGKLGYKFQFITLAGWHLLNYHTFDLASQYKASGMSAYVNLQEKEFAAAGDGYTAVRHQQEVGTGYFDQVLTTISEGTSSTSALAGSTEKEQFSREAHH